MDLCSIEDAFPNINGGSPYVGGTDAKQSREERRAARKLAKKVKGPSLAYSNSNDPDRIVGRLESVGSIQEQKEEFKMPVLPKASCLFSDTGTPAYFGQGQDDTEEGYSSFSVSASDNANYMLQPDVTKTFDLKGVAKAGGELPEPNLDQTWKPMSPAASYTAFTKPIEQPEMPAPKSVVKQAQGSSSDDTRVLMERINTLMGRLDHLEKKRAQDSRTEILVFVGTGLFLILSFELISRR